MSQTQNRETAVQKSGTTAADREVRFIPFGAADEINLSIRIIQNIVAVKTKTGKTCSEQDAMKFLMLCQAQRLNPFAGDAYLVGYDKWDKSTNTSTPAFSLITAIQVFYKRAETCAEYEGIDSGIILLMEDGSILEREGDFCLPDEEVVGGWATVHRKGRKPMKARLSIEAMKPPYDTPFWSKAKAPGQISKCAEADALRRSFPTLLGGLYLQGEMDASANQIVARVTTKPIFEKPMRQIAPDSGNNERREPDHDDGGLGPQTQVSTSSPTGGPANPEAERKVQEQPQPAAEAVKETAEQKTKREVKALKFLLQSKNHTEIEFMAFVQAKHNVDDSLGTLAEWGKVAPGALARAHDQFGIYEAELRQWKEVEALK